MNSGSKVFLSENTNPVCSNKVGQSDIDVVPSGYEFSDNQNYSPMGKVVGKFSTAYLALLLAVLVAAGSYSILPIWIFMSRLWLNDPLRAIGSIFPLLAFGGTIIAWRRIGWCMNGTFWGLPLLGISIFLARISTSFILNFRFHQQNESLLHPGFVMFLYGVGAVLLFGGTPLLRVSLAPLLLLLFINPVPYLFNAVVDLPLQFLSANTARHFAHLIGLQPTGEQLRMMFSPTFGMMIVPGCNGVRGSITLAYLAMIFGYTRHLRWRVLTLTTLAAFLMGYALNLLRLCILVIYYRVGLSYTYLQPHGAAVDYAIGGTLFLFATLGVGLFIRWIEPEQKKTDRTAATGKTVFFAPRLGYAMASRIGCFLVLTLGFILPTLGKGNSFRAVRPNETGLLSSFPSQVGPYRLTRAYPEYDYTGLIRFALADYAVPLNSPGLSGQLTFGIYVGSGMHFVSASRFAQGIRPSWIGTLDASDANVQQPLKVHFVTTLYDDGVSREYDAETVCYEEGCSASIDPGSRGFIAGTPTFSNVVTASNSQRLIILLRREWPDSDGTLPANQRSQFETEARQFTEQLNLRALLREDGTKNQ